MSREGLASSFWYSGLRATAPQPWLHTGCRPGPSSCFSPFPLLLQERETISSFHSSSMAGRLMNLSPAPRPRPAKNVCGAFRGPNGRLQDNRWQQKTQGCVVKFPAAAAAPSDPESHCGNDPSPPVPPELSGSTSLLGAENQRSHIHWLCRKHPVCGVPQ